jgi:hypothetical protein
MKFFSEFICYEIIVLLLTTNYIIYMQEQNQRYRRKEKLQGF